MATLITGGAGFIGLEVVRLLLSRGEKRPLVMSRNPSPKRLGEVADAVEVMRGDLGNFSHVLEAVKKARPQVIYHLGATLSVPSESGQCHTDQCPGYLPRAGSGAAVRCPAGYIRQ